MKNSNKAVAAALAVTLLAWGLSYVWTKVALGAMGPFTLVCVRFSLASGLFGLLFLVTGRRPQRLGRADRWRMFVLALLQPVGHFAFETCGLVYTTASAAALIVAAIPLAVLALAACLGRQQAGAGDLARILVSAGGVSLIILGGGQGGLGGGELVGNLLMLGAVISTAGYVVLGGALVRRLDALTVTFVQLAWGAVLFLPGCLWEIVARGWPAPDGRQLLAVGALTVLAGFAAFLCYNYVLSRLSPARAALWLNAVPVVAAVGAWVTLGERLGGWQFVGGAAVVMAVAMPRVVSLKFGRYRRVV